MSKERIPHEHIPHVPPPSDGRSPPSEARPDKVHRERPKDPPHAPVDPRSHPRHFCARPR